MTSNFLKMLNPQMQQGVQSLYQQAQASGNPQMFMQNKFQNDQIYLQGYKILNEQGISALNNFIETQLNQFNR